MKRIVITGLCALASLSTAAKLPALSDEAKAKAAETAAKTAWSTKVADFQLCKAMDRVAAGYHAGARQAGKETAPVETPPCSDPGPFAAAAPAEAKPPIEAAGAHSPPRPAADPHNTTAPAATQKGQ